MSFWIIEPRDPLIVRDGRPFGPNPGARAATLPFPFPSTLAGALRHKAGLSAPSVFERTSIERILQYGLRGPLLVALDEQDAIQDWLLPAPADALLLAMPTDAASAAQDAAKVQRVPLLPQDTQAITNVPKTLQLVGPQQPHPEKVSEHQPRFWNRNALLDWLQNPHEGPIVQSELGIGRLAENIRTHVSIQPEQQTARDGALFQTSGLEFTWRDPDVNQHEFHTKRLALAMWFDGETPHFTGGIAPLGGERRLMHWSQESTTADLFTAEEQQALYDQILQDGQCRVLLLTPGYFQAGYRPPETWTRGGVAATLKAACVPRAQTVSGWDLAADNGRGAPKPTQRLAPAGSVYFVSFPEDARIRDWLDATWMTNVSDDPRADGPRLMHPEQHRRDGFGLAVVGVWHKEQA